MVSLENNELEIMWTGRGQIYGSAPLFALGTDKEQDNFGEGFQDLKPGPRLGTNGPWRSFGGDLKKLFLDKSCMKGGLTALRRLV